MPQKQRVIIALLALFVLWCGWQSKLSSQPAQFPESGETANKTNKKGANNDPFELFWNWTTRDAVSFYTFVLAIFTGVLGGTAIVQIRYLRKADETARITADAAKLNANAVISAERAHLFVIVVENNVHTAMRGVRFYGGEQSADMHDGRIPRLMLEFVIKNTGRTAAILRDVSYRLLQANADTTEWAYSFEDTIVVPVIEGNSQTAPPTPCVAESELTIADGRAALDGDRPLFFYGFVTFRDTFERDYQYFWRYEYRAGRFALVHEEERHPPSIY